MHGHSVRCIPRSRAVEARLLPLLSWLGASAVAHAQAEDFTVIVMPDTQYYACDYGGSCAGGENIFETQTRWIAAERDALNIRYVAGLGDCVQDGDQPQQYAVAEDAYEELEQATGGGFPDGIPYGLSVGNHDQVPVGDPGRISSETATDDPDQGDTTRGFDATFGVSRFCPGGDCRSYYGDHFGTNNDNHYDLFEAEGYRFVVLHLEYMPTDTALRRAVLDWADDVLADHPDRRAIVVTHHAMNSGDGGSFSNEGRAIYEALKDHATLSLILGGHISGEGRRTDSDGGSTVHTLLSDYQGRANGGEGWLRILEFRPTENRIRVKTWSPWLGRYETDADSDFSLPYDLDDGWPDGPPPEPCASDLEPDGVCNPLLAQSAVVPGLPATLRLTGTRPGAEVIFLATGQGDGGPERCHAAATSVCTPLLDPVLLGASTADEGGAAELVVDVPPDLPVGLELWLQAAWIDGVEGQASEIDVVTVE